MNSEYFLWLTNLLVIFFLKLQSEKSEKKLQKKSLKVGLNTKAVKPKPQEAERHYNFFSLK